MKINKAGFTGFLLCLMAIFFGIATNGGMQTIVNFLHLPSFIMTVGGALFAVMMTSDSFSEFKLGITGFFDALSGKKENLEDIVNCIYDMSEMSRKEGLLSLEDYSKQIQDAYLAKGITLVVDGTESELIRDIMETEMNHKYDNDKRQIGFWQDFGAFAPAWGMVGTLIGLINMMKTMGSDSSAIGDGMSLALITTLYGAILANWVCIPISRKLEKKSAAEYVKKEIIIEGILSIQAGENTRIIKEKIKAILEEK
ncbi:MAG: MotA/TolQ/ExbB proton channel family protein [Lachnospiraceae bacterium]|nr:MotA/TolQ/ExbB proton channel family protein [Lachnospiraceae bacterium]